MTRTNLGIQWLLQQVLQVLVLVLLSSPHGVVSQDATATAGTATAGTATATATATATEATAAPTSGWLGCVDPTFGYELVTIGKPTPVCLVLANAADWTTEVNYVRLNFSPKADDYSRFHVPNSFQQLVGMNTNNNAIGNIFAAGGNITVHAESQTALSFQKQYYDGNDKVFPFLTAIISVDEGKVTGITWDDACVFCGKNDCLDNTYDFHGKLATAEVAKQPVGACFSTVPNCRVSNQERVGQGQQAANQQQGQQTANQQQSELCDILLYVVWTGTDANGRDFLSSANRFSAFPSQSWSDRVNLKMPDWLNNVNPFDNNNNNNNNNNPPATGSAATTTVTNPN